MNNQLRSISGQIVILICLVFLTACIPANGQDDQRLQTDQPSALRDSTISPTTTLQPASTLEEGIPKDFEHRPQLTLPGGLIRIEPTQANPVMGEVPDTLLNEIVADLSQHLEADRSAIDVIRAEAVVWNDGSLGCPQPGMMYTQALVNGYWVILQVGEKGYDYRASDSGYFFRCDRNGLPPINFPVNPGTESPSDQ